HHWRQLERLVAGRFSWVCNRERYHDGPSGRKSPDVSGRYMPSRSLESYSSKKGDSLGNAVFQRTEKMPGPDVQKLERADVSSFRPSFSSQSALRRILTRRS